MQQKMDQETQAAWNGWVVFMKYATVSAVVVVIVTALVIALITR